MTRIQRINKSIDETDSYIETVGRFTVTIIRPDQQEIVGRQWETVVRNDEDQIISKSFDWKGSYFGHHLRDLMYKFGFKFVNN